MGTHHSTRKKSLVIAFHDYKEWKDQFENSRKTNKLMVIDFSASWSRPCRRMEPIFDELAKRYTDIEFIKIDVDELNDVAHEFGIEAIPTSGVEGMPTFILMRFGKEVDRVVGVNRDRLERLIDKHRD